MDYVQNLGSQEAVFFLDEQGNGHFGFNFQGSYNNTLDNEIANNPENLIGDAPISYSIGRSSPQNADYMSYVAGGGDQLSFFPPLCETGAFVPGPGYWTNFPPSGKCGNVMGTSFPLKMWMTLKNSEASAAYNYFAQQCNCTSSECSCPSGNDQQVSVTFYDGNLPTMTNCFKLVNVVSQNYAQEAGGRFPFEVFVFQQSSACA